MDDDTTKEHLETLDPRSGLSHDAIREQLDRILGSPEFHATEKMRDFLRFVVEQTLGGQKRRIKGYTIATQVFGRGDDFDSAQDPIVSIQAGRLRRALERYYLVAGGRDPIVIDIPKGRYIPRFTAQASQLERRRADGTAGRTADASAAVGPSIAVLPFENLTDDPEQFFLAVGLTDELTTELNRFQDLFVIHCYPPGLGSSSTPSPGQASPATGSRFVLQGSVRRDSETVKVSAHLTDTRSGRQIWAESYSHPLEAGRMIATQEEVARSVVAAIASEHGIIARRLSAEARRKPPAELDTYEALLRYYTHQLAPSPESIQACFSPLLRAAEQEPEYGPVWSALATLYCQVYSLDVPGFEGALETALDYAARGVSLEPGSQLGRLILAYADYLVEDSEGFQHEVETALVLNPNSPYTVGTAGYFHVMRGDLDLGMPLLDRAIAWNPCHPSWFHGAYVIDHLLREDYGRALHELQQHHPYQGFWPHVAYAAILSGLGRLDEAKEHVEKLQEMKPDFSSRSRELLRRTLKIDPLLEALVDCLQRAGLEIEGG